MPSVILILLGLIAAAHKSGPADSNTRHHHHSSSRTSLENEPVVTFPAPSGYVRQQLILGPALNVTVREGDKAQLPCIAPHLGDKTVSWIRQKDLAILISDDTVYTSDSRVESIHPPGTDLWGLQIFPVRSSDEGFYQCQINTEPKQSRTVVLIVLEQDLRDSPSAHIVSAPIIPEITSKSSSTSSVSFFEDHRHRHHHEKTPLQLQSKMVGLRIAGEREKFVVEGDNLILACSATLHHDGLYGKHIDLAWWRRDERLSENRESGDNRFTVHQIVGANGVVAELEIYPVRISDSGRYYCRAEPKYQHTTPPTVNTILKEAWIHLQVSTVPPPDASSRGGALFPRPVTTIILSCVFLVSFFQYVVSLEIYTV